MLITDQKYYIDVPFFGRAHLKIACCGRKNKSDAAYTEGCV